MRRQKRLAAFLLALTLLCGLAVPASAEAGVPSAAAGGTSIRDSGGYVHTLSNPILYTWKKPLFNDLPKTYDFFWMDEAQRYEGQNHDVFVVPAGTVLKADKSVWLWDYYECELVLRDGTWYRGPASPDTLIDENSSGGLTEFTFAKSGFFYRMYFTLKSNPAEYADTVFFYVPGGDAAFQAPASYKPAAGESTVKADPAVKPWGADNSGLWNYGRYGRTMGSYLYQRSDGLLTRVQLVGGTSVVEVYDQNFQILTAKTIPAESGMGSARGFFAGKDYNFLIYGAQNLNQSDSQEVIRVVKYSKDWERLGQAGLKGANTTVPFEAGSLRCAEYNGILYIRTCHKMYKSSDGLNHQSNMTVAVRQSDMAVADATYTVGGGGAYVSHSFNQYILIGEDGTAAFLDHGDAYPRAAVLKRHSLREGTTLAGMVEETVYLQKFPGQIGDNETNASLGGLAESPSCYLAVGNLGTAPGSSRDVMLYATSKSNFTGAGVRAVKLAAYAGTSEYGATPQIVKISNDRFLVMWAVLSGGNGYFTETGAYKLAYVFVDGSGNPLGAIQTGTAGCSDCQPILYNGKAVWYSAAAFDCPTFYAIDASTGALTARKAA